LTGENDLLKSLPSIHRDFKCRVIISTLGRLGALAWDGVRFMLCPGFRVNAVDTTGAGDIFHGAFVYCLTQKFELKETLEFSCAAAAINCTAPGARGKIGTLKEIARLRNSGARSELAFSREILRAAEVDAARAVAAKAVVSARGQKRSGDMKALSVKSRAAEIDA
jgi:bifunctional ADP-heptose synthase (sugar kinase/adenylyltransferase)